MTIHMTTQEILQAICMDLKRVALGYHRGSEKMATRFAEEALKRIDSVDLSTVEPYLRKVLKQTKELLEQNDSDKTRENSLMYSTLVQNYVVKNILKSDPQTDLPLN